MNAVYNAIHQFEPLLPSASGEVLEAAAQLIAADGELVTNLDPALRDAMTALGTVIETLYSSRIEHIRLSARIVERATDVDRPDAQMTGVEPEFALARAHARAVSAAGLGSSCGPAAGRLFIRRCHRLLYETLPPAMRCASDGATVVPGEWRVDERAVGAHDAPAADSVARFMERFEQVYAGLNCEPAQRVAAAMAAHHRLLWIHPFTDGNGRVARMVTCAMLRESGIDGCGIWSLSRALYMAGGDGVGDTYKSALHNADTPRMGDYDGRGNLSARMLDRFCVLMLEAAAAQARLATRMCAPHTLRTRLEHCLTQAGVNEAAAAHVRSLLCEDGATSGGDDANIMPADIVREAKGFLVPVNGRLRIRFPVRWAPVLFPGVLPAEPLTPDGHP